MNEIRNCVFFSIKLISKFRKLLSTLLNKRKEELQWEQDRSIWILPKYLFNMLPMIAFTLNLHD